MQALLDSDKSLFDDFVRYAAAQGVAPVARDIARSRKVMEAQLRAYIGRNTPLESDGFYYNIFPIDNVVSRTIEWLEEHPASGEAPVVPERESGRTVKEESEATEPDAVK